MTLRVQRFALFTADLGAKCCDERVCMSVFVSACPLAYLKKDNVRTSRNVLHTLTVAVARSSSDDNVVRYVLPVLWMTPCLPVIGSMARG